MSKKSFFEKAKLALSPDCDDMDGYDYDEMELLEAGSSKSKQVVILYMKKEDEYKEITKSLNRGPMCIVNLEKLPKEIAQKTLYRIEGNLEAIKGSMDKISESVYLLSNSSVAIKTVNEYEK